MEFTPKSKDHSADTLLQDLLSITQVRAIHSSLKSFFILFEENESPTQKQAEAIWMKQITKIESTTKEEILEKLENLVHRNYVESFALEKALLNPLIEKRALEKKLSLLEKSSRLCLKERVSIIASEILRMLPLSENQSVNSDASQFQSAQEMNIRQFVRKIRVYQQRRKQKSGSFFSFIHTPVGYFGAFVFKFNGYENQSSHKTHKGYEYTKLEMKEKKGA